MNALRKIALGICLLAVSAQSVRAEVVYDNLGAGGTNLGDTGSDFGPSAVSLKALAQGFTTGSDPSFLKLQSVDIGAFFDNFGTANRTVSIYSNTTGTPGDVPGSLIATSSATTVGPRGVYTFNFPLLNLTASTKYWVVPQADVDWFWYVSEDESQPVGQNDSGYTYIATRRSATGVSGPWTSTSQPYTVTINAVPEPTSIGLGAVAVAALIGFRLRQKPRSV